MKLRASYHCVYKLQYHLVLVTKYRKKCLSPDIIIFLQNVFQKLALKWDIEIKEFSGKQDHVHLLIETHPVIQMSKLINNFKTVSSRLTRKHFSKHLSEFYWKPYLWTRSYCLITTGGTTIAIIKKYIQSQGIRKSD